MKVHSIIGNELHITTDLSIFKQLENNRDTANVRINSIRKSVENVGWVMVPIVCNEDMEVVDGQGRLTVAKELGLPVAYVVVRGIGISECQSMNTTASNWTQFDFIKSHAGCGKESFVRLLNLIYEFEQFFPKSAIICAATNKKVTTIGIRKGDVEITDADYAYARAFLLDMTKCSESLKKMPGRSDVAMLGMRFAYSIPEVDKERLLKSLNTNKFDIRSSTMQTFLRDLQNHYNKGLKVCNRIYFETEYLKSR